MATPPNPNIASLFLPSAPDPTAGYPLGWGPQDPYLGGGGLAAPPMWNQTSRGNDFTVVWYDPSTSGNTYYAFGCALAGPNCYISTPTSVRPVPLATFTTTDLTPPPFEWNISYPGGLPGIAQCVPPTGGYNNLPYFFLNPFYGGLTAPTNITVQFQLPANVHQLWSQMVAGGGPYPGCFFFAVSAPGPLLTRVNAYPFNLLGTLTPDEPIYDQLNCCDDDDICPDCDGDTYDNPDWEA